MVTQQMCLMFCMTCAEVLDLNESQSLRRVQAHLETTHCNAQTSVRTNEGKGDIEPAPQHGREVELSYAKGRKSKEQT